MSDKVPILVLLGTDSDCKWHASRFDEADAALVTRAAELMEFYVVRVGTENAELHALAEALPVGKIFSSGKAFVPFVARPVFQKLAPLVNGGVMLNSEPAADQPTAAMFTDEGRAVAEALWSKIEIGTVVLAAQPDLYGPGWWQSVVVAIDGDDLTLRWVEPDDPAQEAFHVMRRDVGLRHPRADRPVQADSSQS